MNTYNKNKGTLHSLLFDTLNRKVVTDLEARNNYKDLVFDYCNFLHRLSAIQLSSTLNSKLNKQYKFLEKLEVLANRYKSIGSDTIPNDKFEDFLENLQTHIREWIDADYLEIELKTEEVKWFNTSAYQISPQTTPFLERKKSDAIDVLMQSNRNRVNF